MECDGAGWWGSPSWSWTQGFSSARWGKWKKTLIFYPEIEKKAAFRSPLWKYRFTLKLYISRELTFAGSRKHAAPCPGLHHHFHSISISPASAHQLIYQQNHCQSQLNSTNRNQSPSATIRANQHQQHHHPFCLRIHKGQAAETKKKTVTLTGRLVEVWEQLRLPNQAGLLFKYLWKFMLFIIFNRLNFLNLLLFEI